MTFSRLTENEIQLLAENQSTVAPNRADERADIGTATSSSASSWLSSCPSLYIHCYDCRYFSLILVIQQATVIREACIEPLRMIDM